MHKYSPTWALEAAGKASELPSTVDISPPLYRIIAPSSRFHMIFGRGEPWASQVKFTGLPSLTTMSVEVRASMIEGGTVTKLVWVLTARLLRHLFHTVIHFSSRSKTYQQLREILFHFSWGRCWLDTCTTRGQTLEHYWYVISTFYDHDVIGICVGFVWLCCDVSSVSFAYPLVPKQLCNFPNFLPWKWNNCFQS